MGLNTKRYLSRGKLLWLLALVIAVVAALLLRKGDEVVYLSDTVKRQTLQETVNATGEIAPSMLVDVGAQASGQIQKLYVKLGSVVEKGDLIAEIDSATQKEALESQKARIAALESQLAAARVDEKAAQKVKDREEALWRDNATSLFALENARNNALKAKAQVAQVLSTIKQASIAADSAVVDLSRAKITAPAAGVVVSVPVAEGQTINAVHGAPKVAQIANVDMVLNRMQVAEGDITRIKPGLKIAFSTLSNPHLEHEAVLESVDPGLTLLSQGAYSLGTDTGNAAVYYYARSYVPNTDHGLRIGMTTQNKIIINEAKDALTIPVQAVTTSKDGQPSVRVLESDGKTVREVAIETGLSDGVRVQVVKGLSEGEQVVTQETRASALKHNTGWGN